MLVDVASDRTPLVNNYGPEFGSRDSPRIRSACIAASRWSVPFQVCFCKASMASPLENDEEGVSLEARYLMIRYR